MFLTKVLTSISLCKTLYLNFKTLPLSHALKLPILVGRRVSLIGLHKGCIRITGDCRRFSVRLGVQSEWPIFPNQREWSMLRCSKGSLLDFDLSKPGTIVVYSGFSIVNNGKIRMGTGTLINQHCNFYCAKRIHLGDNCRIGWNTQVMDSDIHLTYDINNRVIFNPVGDVIVGDNVWMASNCCIMKGAVIPSFSIVATKSLINKDFSEVTTRGNFFAGTPAKLLKTGLVRLIDSKLEKSMMEQFENSDERSLRVGDDFNYFEHCNAPIV